LLKSPSVWFAAVIGPELLQQPQQFDVAMRLRLKATTRTQAIEIAIEGELQEIARGIAGSPSRSRHGRWEAACSKVEVVHKGIHEADRVVLGNIVVEALRKAEYFVAVHAGDMAPRGARLEDGKVAPCCHWQC